jgi:hypothetical protein
LKRFLRTHLGESAGGGLRRAQSAWADQKTLHASEQTKRDLGNSLYFIGAQGAPSALGRWPQSWHRPLTPSPFQEPSWVLLVNSFFVTLIERKQIEETLDNSAGKECGSLRLRSYISSMGGIWFSFFLRFVYPLGKPTIPYLPRCQEFGIAYYSLTLDALGLGHPRLPLN